MTTLQFIGDLVFSPSPNTSWASPPLQTLMRDAFTIANLECVLSDITTEPNAPILKSTPKVAKILRDSGIRLVSLANNHTMDLGEPGLRDTISALDAQNILHVGAGLNATEALSETIFTLDGKKIGVIARMDPKSFQVQRGYATEDTPGVALFDLEETLQTAQRMRDDGCDITLCLIHWGLQKIPLPPPWIQDAMRALLQSFDVVAGTHAHILQGTLETPSGVGLYGMGNFFWGLFSFAGINIFNQPGAHSLAALFRVQINSDGYSTQYHMTWMSLKNKQVHLIDKNKALLLSKLIKHCPTENKRLFQVIHRLESSRRLARYALLNRHKLYKDRGRWLGKENWSKLWKHLRDPKAF